MRIEYREISSDVSPLTIAEMSGNLKQSLDRALEIVEAAAKSGAHGLKLKTYTPDTMTLDLNEGELFIFDDKSLWKGGSMYDLYQEAHTPWEWHDPIFKRGRELGLIVFSAPFDEIAVDFLEELDAPCYKIAPFENADIPLIKKVASTGKPIIISTGMATIAELDETIRTTRETGYQDIVLIKCTSTYPATPENPNIMTIPYMRELFGCEVGLSDHTLGIGAAVALVALGATVIEKHFTLSRADGGVDAPFSLEPHELQALVRKTNLAWQAMGNVQYGPSPAEETSRFKSRSLYIAKDLNPGDILDETNIKSIRPSVLSNVSCHFRSSLSAAPLRRCAR